MVSSQSLLSEFDLIAYTSRIGKLPACTACDRAKVECIGFDAISKTNVSRK